MDDDAWELLRPRLLAQRTDAENIVAETDATEKEDGHRLETTLATMKEERDQVDKAWEIAQAPLRACISGHADDITRDIWDKGRKVTKATAAKFAADVLLYVRQHFYEDIAKDAMTARQAGQEPRSDPPQGPFTQKLTLENMKWIFDTKVKPHTEQYGKDIFYCNACPGNFKPFGFEGVIQHYAAKHTAELSLGNVIVHWRAVWPEVPPFNPEGRIFHQTPGAPAFSQNVIPYSNGYGGYPTVPTTHPPYSTAPPNYGTAAGSYGDQYSPHQGYPYVPPTQYPPNTYAAPQSTAPYGTYPPPTASYGAYGSQPPTDLPQSYQQPATGHYPTPAYTHPPASADQYSYNYGSGPSNGQIGYRPSTDMVPPEQFLTQLDDIARNARELWTATAHIKDLPGSVRVFVIIHHMVMRFRARFFETPRLTLFIEGLANNKDMRQVRNVNLLACKACHQGLGNSTTIERERKSFSLPQLVTHFQNKHIEPMQYIGYNSGFLDWTVDMVLLPDRSMMSKLPDIVGRESAKAHLFAEAFPDIFHHPAGTAANGHPQYSYKQEGNAPSNQLTVQASSHHHPPASFVDNASYSYSNHGNGYNTMVSQTSAAIPGSSSVTTSGSGIDIEAPRLGENKSRSSQGARANRDHGFKRGNKSKNGRTKNSATAAAEEAARLADEERAKEAEEEEQVREAEIRAMWAAERATTAMVYGTPAKPDAKQPMTSTAYGTPAKSEVKQSSHATTHQALPATVPTPQSTLPLPQERGGRRQAKSISPQDEMNLMSALERHLNQGHSESFTDQRARPREEMPRDDVRQAIPLTRQEYNPGPASEYSRLRSPGYEQRLDRPGGPEAYRDRIERARDVDVVYSRMPTQVGGVPESRYGRPVYQQLGEHPDDGMLRRREQAIPADDTGYRASGPYQREYIDDPTAGRPLLHGEIEAYEIVQVIDSQGEYYIRRPIRRERLEARYATVYETEARGAAVRRDPEPYDPFEPAGPYLRRPQQILEARSERPLVPAGRPLELIDEEYDPRFPAAPTRDAPHERTHYAAAPTRDAPRDRTHFPVAPIRDAPKERTQFGTTPTRDAPQERRQMRYH
jgi:hypothetical protein